MTNKNLIYDGTFDGFLCCVFYVFEYKINTVTIQKQNQQQQSFFSENEIITTEKLKADRVWAGLKSKTNSLTCSKIYYAFLSEEIGVENTLLDYLQYIFSNKQNVATDFTYPSVLKVAKIAKNVSREKHRMEAFVRFRLTKDAIYFASVEPDFNVLPLISKHFKSRYADQKWVIYDIKRKYGLYYDLNNLEVMEMDFPDNFNFSNTDSDFFADEEFNFQKMWQDYFDSTNIKERKNMKLHVQHVPKRYWKYLSEKQPKF